MKQSVNYFIAVCFLLSGFFAFSQNDAQNLKTDSTATTLKSDSAAEEYVITNQLRYEDWVYVPNIKSVLLYESSFLLSSPVIDIDGGQQVTLSFDDLDADNKPYYYTLVHCDASWKPTDLMQQEYLSNFFEEPITTYTFSGGTTQRYTHYTWSFPNNNIRISKTGNYLFKMYVNGAKDKPVLTRRLMVYSAKVAIKANIHQAAGSDDYMNKQEVDFSIFYPGYNIPQLADLKVIIQQNNRWDNAIFNLQPLYLKPDELSYDYDDGSNTFDAGNEYRPAVFKNFKFVTASTDRMYRDSVNSWHVKLLPDEVKTFKRYYQTTDIDGRFLITVEERDSALIDISAEYAHVRFNFPFDFPMNEGDFYVLGNLVDNHFTKENRMTFNYFTKTYECELYLKQGYYDYLYVFLPDGKPAAETNQIEGDHWETENDYTIYVYHKQQGTYYDQLICVQKFNSAHK
jgi:type 9 secretion system plug protein